MKQEEKTNTATNRNDMKNSASTTKKGMPNKDNKKSTGTEIVKLTIFNLSSKTLLNVVK